MPELPEVETTKRGIKPHLENQVIDKFIIRHNKLRWPISTEIQRIKNLPITSIDRRGKYLLISTNKGVLILHLGMSGSLRIVPTKTPAKKHDHVDVILTNGQCLRFTDPRRFGSLLWTTTNPLQHKLLINLGPEPLSPEFNASYLFVNSRKSCRAIKQFIMDSKIVVGVGNIYATEALFLSGIHPQRQANKISKTRYQTLVDNIKQVLRKAIKQGGTTLKDFQKVDGKPGYFRHKLQAYGRSGLPCVNCNTILVDIKLGQRTTVYCTKCQR